ncbi:MAG: hypothetical protein KY455_06150 [Euryarchaeota archaeon]|nr:hypothetical protein [Euryarchaeota archaeon]
MAEAKTGPPGSPCSFRLFGQIRQNGPQQAMTTKASELNHPFNPHEEVMYIDDATRRPVNRPRLLHIATVGAEAEPILIQVRDYPVSKMVLLTNEENEKVAEGLRRSIAPLSIDVEVHILDDDDILMATLRTVGKIVAEEGMKYDDIIINVSSGEKMLTCSALSAAFVNGVRAIGIKGGMPFSLPVLKFSYTELVSEPKVKILEALDQVGGAVESLNQLAELAGVEKSLLSYHVRGSRDSKGLEPLGLVEVDRAQQGRLVIKITEMGKLMLIGRVLDKPRIAV